MLRHGNQVRALCIFMLFFIAAIASSLRAAAPSDPWIVVEKRYAGVNRPLMITVTAPRGFGTVGLVLLRPDGSVAAPPVEVRPGRIDLAEAMPNLWTFRETLYLQLLDREEPVGPALVLQPMLSRFVPTTEWTTRDGRTFPRITGWLEENAAEKAAERANRTPAVTPPTVPAATPGSPTTDPARPGSQPQPVVPPPPPVTPEEPITPPRDPVFAGFRVYTERDVILHTSHGDIRVAFRPDAAPNTVWNFRQLAEDGFYDDVVFHRIVPMRRDGTRFVIQAGDPTATGEGGPGYWLPIERSTLPHDFGVISMARASNPDSAGSQFFFGLSREGTQHLDGQYCAFGYAVDGAETILRIADTELADVATGRPAQPPVINRAELVDAPPRTPGVGRPDSPVSLDVAREKQQEQPRFVPR